MAKKKRNKKKGHKILIIDIETTGFLKAGGKIVELGMVELDLNTGKIEVMLNAVTHESDMGIKELTTSWIFRNSDLTRKRVRGSNNFETHKKYIQNVVDNYPQGATAYNRSFDFDFLESRGISFIKKLPCPMIQSTPIVKLPSKYPKYGPYKWPSVEEAYEFFFPDSDYIEKHRAADDAIHEAKIIFELHKRGKFLVAK